MRQRTYGAKSQRYTIGQISDCVTICSRKTFSTLSESELALQALCVSFNRGKDIVLASGRPHAYVNLLTPVPGSITNASYLCGTPESRKRLQSLKRDPVPRAMMWVCNTTGSAKPLHANTLIQLLAAAAAAALPHIHLALSLDDDLLLEPTSGVCRLGRT